MKLTIRRNQADVKGFFGKHKGVRFSLSGRVALGDKEKSLIDRYKVGDHVLARYEVQVSDQTLERPLSVNDLANGLSVETDSIGTLLRLEDRLKEGCVNLKNLLEIMASFGGEEVFEI